MKYMLDTDICISLIRQKSEQMIQRLTKCVPGDICVSSITVAELVYGVNKSSRKEQNMSALEQFLLPLEITSFEQRAAIAYGVLRTTLEQKGKSIGSMDMLIGSHALSLGVILVTSNTREFQQIPDLKLEDWMVRSK
jgi:tRNA(fMet)-specific endonuclease VapC